MDISKVSLGHNPPHDINVVIEIPQGGAPVKYEMDKESGAMFVDRFLHTAMFYPANYGFIPHTPVRRWRSGRLHGGGADAGRSGRGYPQPPDRGFADGG